MRISDWSSDVCSSDLGCSLRFLRRRRNDPYPGLPAALRLHRRHRRGRPLGHDGGHGPRPVSGRLAARPLPPRHGDRRLQHRPRPPPPPPAVLTGGAGALPAAPASSRRLFLPPSPPTPPP